ncbi:MAG: histidine phosphatase family protein [Candidatus Omnitrophica bacterium]|nr:histidine phosphatase family protein [Candidatus Omnitrophota bacterium]
MQTRIILIRHGETRANRQRRYVGVTESGLTSYGRYQAKCLKERMAKDTIDRIFVSPSKRALDFSKIVFGNRKKKVLASLQEMNFGVFEGLTYSQALKKYPLAYRKWLKSPQRFNIPKAEPLANFKARVFNALKEIISANPGKSVALVTHGGPIMLMVGKIIKSKNLWKVMPGLASISIIEFNKNKPKILKLNDISHYK